MSAGAFGGRQVLKFMKDRRATKIDKLESELKRLELEKAKTVKRIGKAIRNTKSSIE